MKKIIILAFLIGSAFLVSAQLVLSTGSQIVVSTDSYLVVGSVVNTDGKIDNSGTVKISGNIENNTSGLMATTTVGTVIFNGSSAQEITGDADASFYGTIKIDNSSGVSIKTSTGHSQTINGTLDFDTGLLTLNEFDLTLIADAVDADASMYVQTNSTGQLKRTVASSNILFPVGNSTYNPVTLNNAGVSDTYGVIAVEGKPASFSGTTHIVNESWDVTETNADGSNLTITTQWNSGDEATFDRTRSSIGLTTDVGANVTWGSIGAASGADPYTRSIAGITSVGTFMVGDYFYAGIPIDIKVMLAAAWNDANNNMDKTINSRIPLADPYTGVDVTVSSIPTDAVDWVKVELRNSGNHATVTNTYAKFVDQDGQIIEEDGSNMKITGAVLGSYFVAVHHRNHLGVVSASTVELASSPAVNFSNLQARAWQSGASNAAMKEVESGVFGLWDGNANGDASIVYNGGSSDRVEILDAVGGVTEMSTVISGVYSGNDVNMDGNIVYNGGSSDRVIILDNVGGVTEMSTTLSANLPD